MPTTRPTFALAAAQVSTTPDGAVVFDDPAAPWRIKVWPGMSAGRPIVASFLIVPRDPHQPVPITTSRMTRLPLAAMARIAASLTTPTGQANEVYYRLLAVPKPSGARSWPDDHWTRVLTVFDQAATAAGGSARAGRLAVAQAWAVSERTTVKRWLAEARRRARDST